MKSNPAVERDSQKATLFGCPSALRAPAAPHFYVRAHVHEASSFHLLARRSAPISGRCGRFLRRILSMGEPEPAAW